MNKYALCLITLLSFSVSHSMQSFKEFDMKHRHLADIKRDFIRADDGFEQQMRLAKTDHERLAIEQARTASREKYTQKYNEVFNGSSQTSDYIGSCCVQ